MFFFFLSDVSLYHSFDSLTGPYVGSEFASFMMNNGQFVTGKKNNALEATDTKGFAFSIPTTHCAQNLHLCTNGFTFAIWIKMTKAAGWSSMGYLEFFFSNVVVMASQSNELTIVLHNKNTGKSFTQKMTIRFGQWVHYAVTWDATNNVAVVYENGVEFDKPKEASVTAGAMPNFGALGNSAITYQFDELYIFQKVMDSGIILQLASI